MVPVTGNQIIIEPGCIVMMGAGTRQYGETSDLMTTQDGWRVKKAEGVVSDALSTPSESGYYRVNPR